MRDDMKDVVAEISDLTVPNWDGYGAESIGLTVVDMAKTIVEALKGSPDIAPGGDGSIGFEWRLASGQRFLLVAMPDGICQARLVQSGGRSLITERPPLARAGRN